MAASGRRRRLGYSRATTDIERDFYRQFVNSLVNRRQSMSLTQEALDDLIGVSTGQVAKWETFNRFPSAFLLALWCKALDCNLALAVLELKGDLR